MDVRTIEIFGEQAVTDARAQLTEADVIVGVDAKTGREFTVFGTPALDSTTKLKKLSAMRLVNVPIDCERGQLEELTELVRHIKELGGWRRPR